MKRTTINYLLALLLIASFTFFSCKKEDEEPETGISGKIPGLTANLSTGNGRTIRLSFNDAAGEYITSSFNAYNVYQSEDGGEFSRIRNGLTDTTYTDNSTKHGKTYQYFVNFENMYSDTIEISTAHPAMPWLSASVRVQGEGANAYIDYVRLNYFVGESRANDIVDKFEIYRNEVMISEYQIPSVITGNNFEYKDESSDLSFDQDYVYYIIAHTKTGEQFKSLDASVTPIIPDEIDRPAPQILSVYSNTETNTINIHVKDVSGTATFIDYYSEIEDDGGVYYWTGEPAISNLNTDSQGNYIITLDADDIPGGFKTIKTRARARISGNYSDWSDWNVSSVYINF